MPESPSSPSPSTPLAPFGVPAPLPLLDPPAAAPQAGAGGPNDRGSSHRTVPLVSPTISVFGFVAWGRAGKESRAGGAVEVVGLDTGRDDGAEGGLEDDEPATQAGAWLPPPRFDDDDDAVAPPRAEYRGVEGKGFLPLAMLPQLPCLLTADRLDCAVELLSFKTLLPPAPAAVAGEPGRTPLGPGREG